MSADNLKVAFDIGGLISRYPDKMKAMMLALHCGGCEVFILTDMNQADAKAACRENGIDSAFYRILSADWSAHGDLCKSIVMAEHEIDILIDDRPDYAASGDFIGLVLSPRPDVPYWSPGWVNRLTPAVCVPPEEYEAFKRWKESR